ncbi:MAG: nuclear transport factor 2 family protein [Ferruginibacter sp.]
MNKYIKLSIALLIFITSCTAKKTDSKEDTSAITNAAAIKKINEAIQTGNVSQLGNYIDADVVDHASPMGEVKGLENMKAMLGKIHTMGTNMKMEVIKTVADDEYVFEWMRLSGTTATTDFGMPVGTNYDINSVQVSKFRNGKLVEHWEFMQPADMAKMMGPDGPQQNITVDTVKKR